MWIPKTEVFKAFKEFCRVSNVFERYTSNKFWRDLRKVLPDMDCKNGRIGDSVVKCLFDYELSLRY